MCCIVANLEETIKLKESLFKNGIINFDDIYLTKYEYSQTNLIHK